MLSMAPPEFLLDGYTTLNLLLTAITLFFIVYIFLYKRYLVVKPTFLFLIYAFIFWQVPFTYLSYECEKFLPDPYALLVMIHGFMFIGLFLTSRLFIPQTQEVWHNLIRHNNKIDIIESNYNLFICVLLGLILICSIVYFSYVSFEDTPIMLSFKGADTNTIIMARESALKTLESFLPKYAYTILRSCLAICVVCFSGFALIQSFKEKSYMLLFLYSVAILLAILFSSVVFNKSTFSLLLIGFFLNYIWWNIQSSFKVFIGGGFIIVAAIILAVLVSSIGYYHSLDLIAATIWPMINRTFIVTFKVGTWFIHYAQVNGFIGISAFPKLAVMLGEEQIYLPNFIGKLYAPLYFNHEVLSSVAANAGFIFVNYVAWGLAGLPISLLMFVSLDVALLIMKRLSRMFLIPFLSVIGILLISFTSSTYGASLISHGYLISIIIVGLWSYRIEIAQFFKKCLELLTLVLQSFKIKSSQ
ncbi:MAG: hypothetical protein K2P93_00955 [Alphaproteobacteria bacterium]|nr:hypothetical protein [Alphaproteobacteria bacterium]